ncbi:Serine/threonine-protein kinase AFC2 [Trametes pubescens]|uniref:Serine/threonine-protein kinase AFC2 n=1 Tax=Trametes pubescens TaxID=154538 RepID=A0A1M2W806_TRAPU|nr:Serine/threonine-protein kinase AFC2 [Trametes pubescens]
MHRGFHCTVFELCDATLCDVFKGHGGLAPLPSRHVCEIAFQIVLGVEYLHSLNIVHGDIKPDNIAFKHFNVLSIQALDPSGNFQEKRILSCTAIRLIDLGSAMPLAQAMGSPAIIGAPMYRAPEVDLRMPWSLGVDTFAIGCVIAEVYLFEPLFDPNVSSDLEHLAMVDRIAGPFPIEFARAIETATPGAFRFAPKIELIYPPATSGRSRNALAASVRRVHHAKPICVSSQYHMFCGVHLTLYDRLASMTLYWPTF